MCIMDTLGTIISVLIFQVSLYVNDKASFWILSVRIVQVPLFLSAAFKTVNWFDAKNDSTHDFLKVRGLLAYQMPTSYSIDYMIYSQSRSHPVTLAWMRPA